MNKKLLLITTIFIVVIGYIFNIDNSIKKTFLNINNKISQIYLDNLISLEITINKYFDQLRYIDSLKQENEELSKLRTLYSIAQSKLSEYEKMFHIEQNQSNFNFKTVKVLSNYTLYDNSILKIRFSGDIDQNIAPLVTKEGFSAGVIIKKNDLYLAYLNDNNKCNYAVYIGEENAPGITMGVDLEGHLTIKHIPKWKKINLNDDIITSNMDGIFPFGIKVGKVVHIEEDENTKTVKAKPYASTLGKRFFYIIENKE